MRSQISPSVHSSKRPHLSTSYGHSQREAVPDPEQRPDQSLENEACVVTVALARSQSVVTLLLMRADSVQNAEECANTHAKRFLPG